MKKLSIYIFTLLCILIFLGFGLKVNALSNPYESTGPYGVNCTWYTWDKVKNMSGVTLPAWGNAKTWYNSAKSSGFKVGAEPKNNSIIVWDITEYGHVAYVEKVSENYMYIWDSDKTCIDEDDPEFIECDNNSYDEASQTACRKNAKIAACKLETSIYTTSYKTIGFIYLDEVPSNINQDANDNKQNNSSNFNNDKQNNTNSENNKNNDIKNEEQEVVKSNNNYLEKIILSTGKIDFNKDVLEYEVIVENEISNLEINATALDNRAIITGNDTYSLEVGNNLIKLEVTAENGETREYIINVLRKEKTKEDNLQDENNYNYKKNVILSKSLEITLGVIVLIVGFGVYIFKKENNDK